MRQREFIVGLAGATVATSGVSRAQQAAAPLIGFVSPGAPETSILDMPAFHRGPADTGYVEGRNVAIEYGRGIGMTGSPTSLSN